MLHKRLKIRAQRRRKGGGRKKQTHDKRGRGNECEVPAAIFPRAQLSTRHVLGSLWVFAPSAPAPPHGSADNSRTVNSRSCLDSIFILKLGNFATLREFLLRKFIEKGRNNSAPFLYNQQKKFYKMSH